MSTHEDEAPKPRRGRPVEKTMPDQIPDTPENVMKALLNAPPRDEDDWDYLKEEPRNRP